MQEGEQVETIEWARQDSPAPGGEGRGSPHSAQGGGGVGGAQQPGGGGGGRWDGEAVTPRRQNFLRIAY